MLPTTADPDHFYTSTMPEPQMQTRKAKVKALEAGCAFATEEAIAAAHEWKASWAKKYRDNWQLQKEHLEKYRLRVPIQEKDIEADFVGMKIWRFDGTGGVVMEGENATESETEVGKMGSRSSSPHSDGPSEERKRRKDSADTSSEWEINHNGGTKVTLKRKRAVESKVREDLTEVNERFRKKRVEMLQERVRRDEEYREQISIIRAKHAAERKISEDLPEVKERISMKKLEMMGVRELQMEVMRQALLEGYIASRLLN